MIQLNLARIIWILGLKKVPYVLIVEDLVIAHNIYSFIRISLINIALYLA